MCVIICEPSCFKSMSNNFNIRSLWGSDYLLLLVVVQLCFFMCRVIFDNLLENVFEGVHCKIM